MEGPSLLLAAQQLVPFINQKVKSVDGNTKIGKERMQNQKIVDIFSWGKHLVLQFDRFALRVHFMLFGSFEAVINDKSVSGDYPRKNRAARLALTFKNGQIALFSCSLIFIEENNAKQTYDFTIDTISEYWDSKQALQKILLQPDSEIADVLLDQTIFAGAGNIIKNETLFLAKILPETQVKEITKLKLKKLIDLLQQYVHQFYAWRKNFELRKHYQIYKKKTCLKCKGDVIRKETGKRKRLSYFCVNCQH